MEVYFDKETMQERLIERECIVCPFYHDYKDHQNGVRCAKCSATGIQRVVPLGLAGLNEISVMFRQFCPIKRVEELENMIRVQVLREIKNALPHIANAAKSEYFGESKEEQARVSEYNSGICDLEEVLERTIHAQILKILETQEQEEPKNE